MAKIAIELQQIIMALLKFWNVWNGKVCQNKQGFNYHIIRVKLAKLAKKGMVSEAMGRGGVGT